MLIAIYILCKNVEMNKYIELLLYLVPYFTVGYDVLWRSVKNIAHGQVFDENFLMAIATVGAFFTSEYSEAVFVMLFYQIGELFQSIAVGKSRRSITDLMDLRPDSADVLRDGEIQTVDPDEVSVGEIIVVRPGEKVPIDGVIIDGETRLDMAALTGESVPRTAKTGDKVVSGSINLSGLIKIRTTKEFGASTVSKILELVESASSQKSKPEAFITRFSKIYTPTVVFAAVALAVIPSLIVGDWSVWVGRALTFLVVSCPCALVISVPLAYFSGIGGASKNGILIKGSSYMESLGRVKSVVFDKTGTLTKGCFKVSEVVNIDGDDDILSLAASAEKYSSHPIAVAIAAERPNASEPSGVTEIAGEGIKAEVCGHDILCGNEKLMRRIDGADIPSDIDSAATCVFVAKDGRLIGYILISDEIKAQSYGAIDGLKRAGIKTVMLTGDKASVAEKVGYELGIDEIHAELMPSDKVARVEDIMAKGGLVSFVGDGINDAPVLMRSDVGIAMGALGSDAAIEAADIVLIDDDPSKISLAISKARKTCAIVRENISFAIMVKLLVLVLCALGIAPMGAAVFADVGVAVIAILNSMRALK